MRKINKSEVITYLLILIFLFAEQYLDWAYIIFYFITIVMVVRIHFTIRIQLIKKYFGLFVIPNVLIFIHSIVVSVINSDFFFLGRSVNMFVLMLMCIFFSFCIYIKHRERTLQIILESIILFYFLQIVISLFSAGILVFLKNILRFGSPALTKWLETHDVGLSIGLVLIYYMYFEKKKTKQRRNYLIFSILIFLLCYKRIAFIGLAAVCIFRFIYNKRIDRKRKLTFIWGIIGVIICFAYVYMIRNEYILGWFWQHGISTMGRDNLYRYFKNYYSFNLAYLGRGNGYTAKTLSILAGTINNPGSIAALHSDILRAYIEYGFLGSLLWYTYYLIILPKKAALRAEKYSDVLFLLTLYSFVIYLTDNTSNYVLFQTLYMLIPLCVDKPILEYKTFPLLSKYEKNTQLIYYPIDNNR